MLCLACDRGGGMPGVGPDWNHEHAIPPLPVHAPLNSGYVPAMTLLKFLPLAGTSHGSMVRMGYALILVRLPVLGKKLLLYSGT